MHVQVGMIGKGPGADYVPAESLQPGHRGFKEFTRVSHFPLVVPIFTLLVSCQWPPFGPFEGTKHCQILSSHWLFFLFIPCQRTENKYLRPGTLEPTTADNAAPAPHPVSCNVLINRLYSWYTAAFRFFIWLQGKTQISLAVIKA